jgi:predicted nucleotidyltransferase
VKPVTIIPTQRRLKYAKRSIFSMKPGGDSSAPTPYPEVKALLFTLLASVQAILREKLVGFYLFGSLSQGDFDPDSSDVDFLVVTTEELSGPVLDDLREMHARIAASDNPYARRLEGSYTPRDAVRRYDPRNAVHPTIGVDWNFGVGLHESNWIFEYHIVREHGVVLWGPTPKTLIDPVSPSELRAAVCKQLRSAWVPRLTALEWLRPRHYQAFAILTLCRALYTLTYGTVVSKPRAAAWACRSLDPRWRPTIERALIWRREHEPDDVTDTLDFLRFAVMRGLEQCES